MSTQQYILQFKSLTNEIVDYDNPIININEVLLVSDLFSLKNAENIREHLIKDFRTDTFLIAERKFIINEDLSDDATGFILLTLEPYF